MVINKHNLAILKTFVAALRFLFFVRTDKLISMKCVKKNKLDLSEITMTDWNSCLQEACMCNQCAVV